MIFFTFCVFYFLLGTIIGSFLNVVILRTYTGKSLGGRSECPNCSAVLNSSQLVPIFSYLFQRGKCKNCKAPISSQYIIVEILAGILFFLSAFYSGLLFYPTLQSLILFLLHAFIWSVLLVLAVYDFKHKILPDLFVALFAVSAVLLRVFDFVFYKTPISLGDILAGPILFLFFFSFWFFSRGRAMGFGDAKLAFGMGILLGLPGSITATAFAFWIGAIVALTLLLIPRLPLPSSLRLSEKALTMKSEIPFGPFLIIATALVFFYRINLLEIIFFQ